MPSINIYFERITYEKHFFQNSSRGSEFFYSSSREIGSATQVVVTRHFVHLFYNDRRAVINVPTMNLF